MSTISSAGISSGLNVDSIVTQLMAIEKQPLQVLQTKAGTIQTQMSAIGQLQSQVSGLHDAADALSKADAYTQMSATASDSALTVSATAKAATGSHAITVSTLAAGQTLVSAAGQFAAATDTVGTGKLTISLGRWSGGDPPTAFTPKSGSTDITIDIGNGDATLQGIRDKINSANAGVVASIVTDTSGARLSLRSASTGQDNGFRITVTDDDSNATDAAGLSRLAYDPAGNTTQMLRAQAASDTQATVDGIAVSSATDTLDNVIEGLTIKINKPPGTAVSVAVAQNTDNVKSLVGKFVSAFNALSKTLSDDTRYDPATKTAALFQGDSTVLALQNQMRSLVSQGTKSSAVFGTLSSLGVQLQKEGSLTVDDTKFGNALGKLAEVAKALANSDSSQGGLGIAKRFANWADGLVDAAGGALSSRTKTLQSRLNDNQKQQDALNDRLSNTERRLRTTYSALDTTASKYSQLSNYVNQYVTQLANTKSSGS